MQLKKVKNMQMSISKNLDIYAKKEDIIPLSILTFFLVILQIWSILEMKLLGLFITIVLAMPTYILFVSLYKRFKYPILQIYDECLIYTYGAKKIYFEDIDTLEFYHGKNTSIVITLKNKQRYAGVKFKHPPFEKDKISFNIFDIDYDRQLLEQELKKKAKDIRYNILENSFENITLKDNYIPNKVDLWKRFFGFFGIIFLILYSLNSIKKNSIVVPGRGHHVELTDVAMYIMILAVFFLILRILLVIVDHYDKRNNEDFYKNAKITMSTLGWISFFAALMYSLFVQGI